MSTWRTLLAASLLAVAACSSDNNNPGPPDGPPVTTPDAPPPAPDAPTATFAGFVKDLILDQTADNTAPVAVDFASPDSEDPNSFSSLFGSN